jgi:hypothetical protein
MDDDVIHIPPVDFPMAIYDRVAKRDKRVSLVVGHDANRVSNAIVEMVQLVVTDHRIRDVIKDGIDDIHVTRTAVKALLSHALTHPSSLYAGPARVTSYADAAEICRVVARICDRTSFLAYKGTVRAFGTRDDAPALFLSVRPDGAQSVGTLHPPFDDVAERCRI